MVDDESMLLRVIIIATIAFLVGCASLPPDLACRAGIKRLDHAANDKEVYSAAQRANFEAIVRTAERLEDSQAFERCERLVQRTKPRDFQCEVDFGGEFAHGIRRVPCSNQVSLRIPKKPS